MSRKKKSRSKKVESFDEIVETVEEAPAVETAEEVPSVVEPFIEEVSVEEIEAVVEEVPQDKIDEIVASPLGANKANYTHKAWWNEIGARLCNRGYSQKAVVNKAKIAFGSEFDDARFIQYCEDNNIAGNGRRGIPARAKAVWESQK